MFEHTYMSERLGWQKLEETLRLAEEQRRVRQATAGRPGLWRRLIARVLGGVGQPAGSTTIAGRPNPHASGAGEVPGL